MIKRFFVVACLSAFALASVADAQVLFDNGVPDLANGFSHGDTNSVGEDRFLLDDFDVAPTTGDSWEVTGFTLQHVWGTAPAGVGPAAGLTLEIYNDSAGTPDVAGGVVDTASVLAYTETNLTATMGAAQAFSRDVFESAVDITPINICPGTYWFRARMEGAPENNFWLTAAINGNESWRDYAGVLLPSSDPDGFNGASDISWAILGTEVTSGACGGMGCADPATLTPFRGSPIGTPAVGDFAGPDGTFASYNPGFTINNQEAPVWVILDYAAAASGSIDVTSQAGTPGLEIAVEYNDGSGFVEIGRIAESFNSFTTETFSLGGVSTSQVRVGWRQAGFIINFPWRVDIDAVGLCQ